MPKPVATVETVPSLSASTKATGTHASSSTSDASASPGWSARYQAGKSAFAEDAASHARWKAARQDAGIAAA